MKWQIFWAALAVIFILYGLAVLSVGSGTGFWAVWMGLGALSILFAVLAHIHLWRSLPLFAKGLLLTAVTVCAAVFILTEAVIIKGSSSRAEKDLDYIIVLGAQINRNGPSYALKYRLDAAYEYLQNNEETLCIVSGGQGYNEPCTEAEGMRQYLTEKGIPEERILTEDQSVNTKQNIDYSMALLDPETARVGIVTNNFHIFRACSIAKKAGIRHVYPIPAHSSAFYLPNNLLREFFGVMKDLISGNM